MSTSEAVGRAVHEAVVNGPDWETIECAWGFDDLSDADRAVWTKIGMAAVKAHDAARWRVPMPEDWESRRPVQILWWDRGERIGPVTAVLASRRYLTRPGIGRPEPCPIMIAEPLPLPELPG